MSNRTDSAQPHKSRTVALVGRPNVGKSAVFNRIAGRRIAIVFGEPGVTRDRLERDVERDGERFRLADTGGILALDGERLADRIDAGVVAQARAAIGDAGAVVLVVDAQEGLHPLDLEVARLLRKAGADAIVAANKADNPALDAHAADFARLGFPVFPVSALHGRGFDALLAEALRRLPPAETAAPVGAPEAAPDGGGAAAPPPDRPVAVAIVGRPNAGKSSFVNRLLKTERLIVSDVPGTTRDPIDVPLDYGGRKFVLVDTAGVRREARVDTAVERYSRYRTQDAMERADLVVLMLESQRGAGLLDKQLAGMVAQSGKGCVIAVNKWDLEHPDEKEFLETLARELPFMAHCPVVFLSAKTGFRVERVLSAVAHVADASRAALPTGPLNRCLRDAYAALGSAGRNGRPLKMYYAVQTGFNPVRVRIFVNDPGRLPASLEQFLAGALRREFDLAGVGVALQFRARRRADGSTAERAPAPSSRAAKKAGGKPRERRRKMARG